MICCELQFLSCFYFQVSHFPFTLCKLLDWPKCRLLGTSYLHGSLHQLDVCLVKLLLGELIYSALAFATELVAVLVFLCVGQQHQQLPILVCWLISPRNSLNSVSLCMHYFGKFLCAGLVPTTTAQSVATEQPCNSYQLQEFVCVLAGHHKFVLFDFALGNFIHFNACFLQSKGFPSWRYFNFIHFNSCLLQSFMALLLILISCILVANFKYLITSRNNACYCG